MEGESKNVLIFRMIFNSKEAFYRKSASSWTKRVFLGVEQQYFTLEPPEIDEKAIKNFKELFWTKHVTNPKNEWKNKSTGKNTVQAEPWHEMLEN